MATSDWAIPTGKAVTGATYIKDTDDYIGATIEDLVDWCNNANGTYNDWTLTGLRTDFVDVDTAQTITAVKTIDTLGAIDFTGGELRIGGVAVTSTATELNILDGVTSTASEINVLDGISPTLASTDLDKTESLVSGTYTPTATAVTNISSPTGVESYYTRIGNIVTVFGSVTASATVASTSTEISLTIPVAMSTTFTTAAQARGTMSEYVNNNAGIVRSRIGTQTVAVRFISQSTSLLAYYFSFSYEIL